MCMFMAALVVVVLVAQSCPTLYDPTDCSPPGSSVHGILQARILEWIAIPSPGDLPDPGIEPVALASPALVGGLLTTSATKPLDIANWLG